jgi:hypothetical protein
MSRRINRMLATCGESRWHQRFRTRGPDPSPTSFTNRQRRSSWLLSVSDRISGTLAGFTPPTLL